MDDKQRVLAKIIAYKFGYDDETAGRVADDMMEDDFPKNGVRTIGEAIAYIDFVHGKARLAAGTGPAIA